MSIYTERIICSAGLNAQAIPGHSIIEVFGDNRILIERHGGITAFDESCICIKTSYGSVQISGNNLKVDCMSKEQLIINGDFDSLTILKKG